MSSFDKRVHVDVPARYMMNWLYNVADFSKAFDIVLHDSLLIKLAYYGNH